MKKTGNSRRSSAWRVSGCPSPAISTLLVLSVGGGCGHFAQPLVSAFFYTHFCTAGHLAATEKYLPLPGVPVTQGCSRNCFPNTLTSNLGPQAEIPGRKKPPHLHMLVGDLSRFTAEAATRTMFGRSSSTSLSTAGQTQLATLGVLQ